MSRIWCSAIALGALMMAGCVTTVHSDTDVKVRLHCDGTCVVNDRVVKLDDLPKALKSIGVKKDSAIRIAVDAHVPENSLVGVTGALATAGYRKVYFTTPRKATATVGNK